MRSEAPLRETIQRFQDCFWDRKTSRRPVVGIFVESVMPEIDLSDSTLRLEEIEAVAGTGETFLDRDPMLEYFRKELWVPTLLDRWYYQG